MISKTQPLVAALFWIGVSAILVILLAEALNLTSLVYWQKAAYLMMASAAASLAVMEFTTRSYHNSKAGKK